MKTILVLSVLFFIGCGGSGGDTTQEPGSNPSSILCEHDGDLWLCNEENSCIRDQSATEEVVATEEAATGRIRLGLKMSSGAITIIAECGSSVNFNNNEEVHTTNTTTTANLGVNTAGDAQQ